MKQLLSIIASIGEMDSAYIIIALIVIAVLWVVFKKTDKNKNKE